MCRAAEQSGQSRDDCNSVRSKYFKLWMDKSKSRFPGPNSNRSHTPSLRCDRKVQARRTLKLLAMPHAVRGSVRTQTHRVGSCTEHSGYRGRDCSERVAQFTPTRDLSGTRSELDCDREPCCARNLSFHSTTLRLRTGSACFRGRGVMPEICSCHRCSSFVRGRIRVQPKLRWMCSSQPLSPKHCHRLVFFVGMPQVTAYKQVCLERCAVRSSGIASFCHLVGPRRIQRSACLNEVTCQQRLELFAAHGVLVSAQD